MTILRIKYFAVVGSTAFPMDMLHYDQCWPRGSDDASNMTTYETNADVSLRRRIVVLATCANRHTPARWSSFGWAATALRTESYDAREEGKVLWGRS